MHIAPLTEFVCPIDGAPLIAAAGGFACASRHAFDRAREGYVNLLPAQHKASRDPGDSREMVTARRRVLERGSYTTLADRVASIAVARASIADRARPFRIVDAGCGEGYYLDRMARALAAETNDASVQLAGIDISKWAVRAAAKRGMPAAFAVASNRRLPFASGSVDLILSLFGFPSWEGFAAVQAAGGQVLLADPGSEHLIELREVIYPSVTRSGPPALDAAVAAGYGLADEQRVVYRTDLDSQAAIQDLLAMTPHAHRMAPAGRAALEHVQQLTVTIDVVLRDLRRRT